MLTALGILLTLAGSLYGALWLLRAWVHWRWERYTSEIAAASGAHLDTTNGEGY